MVAEADGLVVPLTALELECDTLFTAVLLDDLGGDAGAVNNRSAHFGVGSVIDEENFAELDFVVSGHRKLVDTDGVAFRDAILFTAGFENCVGHLEWVLECFPRARTFLLSGGRNSPYAIVKSKVFFKKKIKKLVDCRSCPFGCPRP